jgi:MFS family permease
VIPSPLLRALLVGAVGRAGNGAFATALLLSTLATGGGASQGGLLIAMDAIGGALFGPFVGGMVDAARHPRGVFVSGLAVRIAATLAIAIGITLWSLPVLAVLAFVGGMVAPVLVGAWTGVLREVAPDVPAQRAYSLDVATYNIGDIAGPALASVALLFGPRGPLWMEVAIFTVGLGLMAIVVLPTHPERPGWRHGLSVRRVINGSKPLVTRPLLRRSTVITSLAYGFTSAFMIAAPLVGHALGRGYGFGGVLLVTAAIAALITSLLMARLGPGWQPDAVIVLGTVGVGASFLFLAFAPTWQLAVVAAAIFGVVDTLLITAIFQVRDRETTEAERAQVFTVAASIRTGTYAAGAAISGRLATAGGPVLVLVVAAIAQPIAVLTGLLLVPPHRLMVRFRKS